MVVIWIIIMLIVIIWIMNGYSYYMDHYMDL